MPQTLDQWVRLFAVVLAIGAFAQITRTATAALPRLTERIEALEVNAKETAIITRQAAQLQQETAAAIAAMNERLRQQELAAAKDAERIAQVRADLDRLRGGR